MMNIGENILAFLKEQKILKESKLGEMKITDEQNKNGEKLLYVGAYVTEKEVGNTYSNSAIYYGFNQNGEYVGCVRVTVLNTNPPSLIEMEYFANETFENQGNITLLAKEVINEIFKENKFDGLKVRSNFKESSIDTIMVDINEDNLSSLAVARKLGFNDDGYLYKNDYLEKISEKHN